MKNLYEIINAIKQTPTEELKAIFYYAGKELQFKKHCHYGKSELDELIERINELEDKRIVSNVEDMVFFEGLYITREQYEEWYKEQEMLWELKQQI